MSSRRGRQAAVALPGSGLTDGDAVTLSTDAATQITATQTAILGIVVRARTANTDDILVGASTVAQGPPTRGYELGPGESLQIEIDDLSKVFFRRATSGSSPVFSWVALT